MPKMVLCRWRTPFSGKQITITINDVNEKPIINANMKATDMQEGDAGDPNGDNKVCSAIFAMDEIKKMVMMSSMVKVSALFCSFKQQTRTKSRQTRQHGGLSSTDYTH